jgi:hypothetical protein
MQLDITGAEVLQKRRQEDSDIPCQPKEANSDDEGEVDLSRSFMHCCSIMRYFLTLRRSALDAKWTSLILERL